MYIYIYIQGWDQPSVGHCRRVLFMEHPLTKRWSFHWKCGPQAHESLQQSGMRRDGSDFDLALFSSAMSVCPSLSGPAWKFQTDAPANWNLTWWGEDDSWAQALQLFIDLPYFVLRQCWNWGIVYLYKCSCAKRVLYDKQWKKLGVSFLFIFILFRIILNCLLFFSFILLSVLFYILRLFQHTFGTHPEQPLPTGYKPGFLS